MVNLGLDLAVQDMHTCHFRAGHLVSPQIKNSMNSQATRGDSGIICLVRTSLGYAIE